MSTIILLNFKYTLKSNYKYNRNSTKFAFDTMAQYWNVILTTNINKSDNWTENALTDSVQNCYEKRYFIQFTKLILC